MPASSGAQPVGGDDRAAPRGIDVKPDAGYRARSPRRRAAGRSCRRRWCRRSRRSSPARSPALVGRERGGQRRRDRAARLPSVGDEAHRVAADPGLMGDLEPGEMARRARHRTPGAGRRRGRPSAAKLGVCRGQGADQRGVVGFGAAGREMTGGSPAAPARRATAADHMRLDRHRRRRGRRGRELRVEGGDDPVGALRREARSRVEQAEIARVRRCG